MVQRAATLRTASVRTVNLPPETSVRSEGRTASTAAALNAPARITGAILALTVALSAATRLPAALSPEQALASFRTSPGLRVELVAAEPLVVDPVAFAFDERGRLYVVEARGYPDLPGRPTREGRVALLEDVDRDGRFDRRTEFAGGFTHPNGVAVWRGGVFVTCAPDIHYLKDDDGDGVADQRTVVLTGFQTGASAQNYTSHPTLGLDGRIYITCGLRSGGAVTSPLHPGRKAVEFSPMDGRFDPDRFIFETTGGRSQFGLAFDAFGRRFVCDNRNPVLQVMLEPAHLRRNPYLRFAETTQAVSKVQAEAKVMRISRAAVTADFIPTLMSTPHAGTFTSACSLLVFEGGGLPAACSGNLFVCEPAQNLIQRQTLRPHGASFQSEAVFEGGAEFMASTDVAFRPVFLANGPDGALYVADMYRTEIDHPTFIPEEARRALDFEAGKGTGRIYRVVGAGIDSHGETPAFESLADLLGALESRDAWTRETARRLLFERADRAAGPRLAALATDSAQAEARCSALWLLRHFDGLTAGVLERALQDPDARVREQGVILATSQLEHRPGLGNRLAAMARDPDARVRFLVALGLGSVAGPEAIDALAAIVWRDADDRWTRAAVSSGIGARAAEFIAALLTRSTTQTQSSLGLVVREASRIVGTGGTPAEARLLLARAKAADRDVRWIVAVTLGLTEGVAAREPSRRASSRPLARLFAEHAAALGHEKDLLQQAAKLALDDSAGSQDRANAVALLGYGDFELSGAPLSALLEMRHSADLRLEAVRSLERIGDVRGAGLLVRPDLWPGYGGSLRGAIVSALSVRREWAGVLFAAVERGTIRLAEISTLQRNFLLRRADPAVRRKAAALFEAATHDRMQVYRSHLDVLRMESAAARGEGVFVRVCASCHTYAARGGNIGPDLTGIRHQPREAILLHTLVPNSEIAPDYASVTLTLKDGGSRAGRIVAETATSLTLRTVEGADESILRRTIDSLQRSGVSLMPDGLEQAMTRQELADLVAYLKSDVK